MSHTLGTSLLFVLVPTQLIRIDHLNLQSPSRVHTKVALYHKPRQLLAIYQNDMVLFCTPDGIIRELCCIHKEAITMLP